MRRTAATLPSTASISRTLNWFAGPCVTFLDDRFDYGEERLITLGLLARRLVTIAHAPRGAATRIISMWKANRREQKIYQKRLGTA
jgi:uncharacterized DUF497 family protein